MTMETLVLAPELAIALFAMVVLGLAAFFPRRLDGIYVLTQMGLLFALSLSLMQWLHVPVIALHDMYLLDVLGWVLKIGILLSVFVVVLYGRLYVFNALPNWHGEYHALLLLSTLGMLVLVQANHLLVLYLGLELMSLPLYAMLAMERERGGAQEAALKYFIMGAMASGFFLYGCSLIYGVTHSLSLGGVTHASMYLSTDQNGWIYFSVGMVFMAIGVAIKFGVVPFHLWVADVYQGTNPATLNFFSGPVKLGVFALLARIFYFMLPVLHPYWTQFWLALGVLSVAVGNILALKQKNLQRLMGYSAIAHMGFVVLALCAPTPGGLSAALFYILSYVITIVAFFGLLTQLQVRDAAIVELDDLAQLSIRRPFWAFTLLLLIFSMAGVPPLLGFFAKFAVLQILIATHHILVAVMVMLLSVVAAYYYLQVIRSAYFSAPSPVGRVNRFGFDVAVILGAHGLMVLWLGISPAMLLQWCRHLW